MTRRKGLTHDEVAHRWANDPAGEDYASGRTLFFEHGVIYSYGHHFPIARHVTNEQGKGAILFTTRDCSISTSKHRTITWRACYHLTVFRVPMVEGTPEKHNLNMRAYQASYDAMTQKAGRCSVAGSGPDWELRAAQEILETGNAYANFFGLDDCVIGTSALHIKEINDRWARLNSPEAQAKRERNAEKRAAINLEHNKEKIEAWLAGENVYLGSGLGVPCLLRLKFNSGTFDTNPLDIETSWGARFSVADAKLAFRVIQKVMASGETWHTKGDKIKLGHYAIDKITADGTVRAGCHLVLYPAIERIAKQLGLIP